MRVSRSPADVALAKQQIQQGTKRRAKYGNRKTTVDGIRFDSAKEAKRYSELKMLEQAGEIRNLQRQVLYRFLHNDIKIGAYRADFDYTDRAGQHFVEDVKSAVTSKLPMFRLKRNLMRAFYGIEVLET